MLQSLFQVVLGCGLNGYLNTKPNRVFGALGSMILDSFGVFFREVKDAREDVSTAI